MPYLRTQTITATLAAWLRAWTNGGDAPTFDHVATYDAPDLLRALGDLLVVDPQKNQAALVVPSTQRYEGDKTPGRIVSRRKFQTLTVILAIRDVDGMPTTTTDDIEVAEFTAVTALVDQVVDAIADAEAVQPLLPGTQFFPESGGPQEIREEENGPTLWRAFLLRFETPAGLREYRNATV